MIIGYSFLKDNNESLTAMQHDSYNHNVAAIVEAARAALIHADAILQSNLKIAEEAREIKGFDHRTLQDTHDILAMTFRYLNDDGGQLKLSETCEEQNNRYLHTWNKWLGDQLSEHAKNPLFVRSVVEAVIFSNSEMSYMA
jgi:hypothetical protein